MEQREIEIFNQGVKHGEEKCKFSLIKKWGINRTHENCEKVNIYLNSIMASGQRLNLPTGFVTSDGCYFGDTLPDRYTEISYEQFRFFVLGESAFKK